jgi:hypothetical protein
VIAEAALARNSLWSIQRAAKRTSTRFASATSSAGLAAAGLLGAHSIAAVRMFESLPRRKQILWVSAPYAVVILLVLILVQLREPPATAPVIPVRSAAVMCERPQAIAVAETAIPTIPTPAPSPTATPLSPREPPATARPEEERAWEEDPAEGAPSIGRGTWHVLHIPASLRARP